MLKSRVDAVTRPECIPNAGEEREALRLLAYQRCPYSRPSGLSAAKSRGAMHVPPSQKTPSDNGISLCNSPTSLSRNDVVCTRSRQAKYSTTAYCNPNGVSMQPCGPPPLVSGRLWGKSEAAEWREAYGNSVRSGFVLDAVCCFEQMTSMIRSSGSK